jgi:F-type H+-transporting ATPase subunit b
MQIKLAPDLSLLAIIAIFIINYLIVRKFFIRPINRILEDRETETRTAEQMYEEAMSRFNDATTQMENQLHAARKEGATVRERFRAEAATHRNKVLERTHGEAGKVVGEADTQLAATVKTAREKIVTEAESLARVAAERILGRAI